MYCWKCGKQNPDDAAFCNQCGDNLREIPKLNGPTIPKTSKTESQKVMSSSPESTHRSETTEPHTQPSVTSQNETTELRSDLGQPAGVGGWLAFFCFGLTVLTPLAAIGGFLDETQKQLSPVVVIIDGILYFGVAAYCIVIGIRIWMVKPEAIREAKILLIVLLALGLIEVAIYAATTQTSDAAIATGVGLLVGSVVPVVIWWLYLSKSKRVRNTFEHTFLIRRKR